MTPELPLSERVGPPLVKEVRKRNTEALARRHGWQAVEREPPLVKEGRQAKQ
jgi:hypothetical protein